MKKHTAIALFSLLASTALAPAAFAADTATSPAAATASAPATKSEAPAKTSKAVEKQKDQVTQESSGLSAEKAKEYNDAMQAAIDSNNELRAQIRKAHEEADAILVAEKFDKKAFLAKAAELNKLYDTTRGKMDETFASTMEKFSQEDRKILLKARNDRRRHSN